MGISKARAKPRRAARRGRRQVHAVKGGLRAADD